jgi:LPS export ABC transporter protein LptC
VKKNVLRAFFGAAAVLLAHRPPAAAQEGITPDQILSTFVLDAFAGGEKEWALRAPRAFVYEVDSRVDVERPWVRFYDKGEPGSELQAGRGRLFGDRRDLYVWDGVVLVSTDGVKLETEWVDYKSALDLIMSTAPVTVTQKGSVVRGVGWEAKPDLSQIVIRNQEVEWTGFDPRRR